MWRHIKLILQVIINRHVGFLFTRSGAVLESKIKCPKSFYLVSISQYQIMLRISAHTHTHAPHHPHTHPNTPPHTPIIVYFKSLYLNSCLMTPNEFKFGLISLQVAQFETRNKQIDWHEGQQMHPNVYTIHLWSSSNGCVELWPKQK